MDKNFIKNIIENHLKDRIKDKDYKFKYALSKSSGISEGYIAEEENHNQYFMIKSALKSGYSLVGARDKHQIISNDSVNFVNEYITAPLYRRILYNRSPLIEILESSESSKMRFRSKFLDNFQTLAEFTKSNQEFSLGNETKLFKQVKGAENLFTAIIFCGESDIHAGNLGVIDEIDESGDIVKTFAKIDHGWSASKFFSKPIMMIKSFENAYDKYGYKSVIDLDNDRLIDSFQEVLNIKDEEIKMIIGERIYKLKTTGFDVSNLKLPFWMNDSDNDYEDLRYAEFNNFEQLEKYYIANFCIQKQVIGKILESLKRVTNDNSLKEDGNWQKFVKQNKTNDAYIRIV